MKALTIIRHAKAERPEGFANDFDRPLNERGRKDAVRLADLLKRIDPTVDWWVSSPALRTRETTELLAASYGYTKNFVWEMSIYEAAPDTLLTLLMQTPQNAEHVVLVGHNPGMAELVAGLAAGEPGRLNLHMPTGGLAHLTMEIFRWQQIRWGCGQLALLSSPKVIRK
jgi:phosphohistidine phosphatase